MGTDPNSMRFLVSPMYGTLVSVVRMCIDTGPKSPGLRNCCGGAVALMDAEEEEVGCCWYVNVPGPPVDFHGDVKDNFRVNVCDAIALSGPRY